MCAYDCFVGLLQWYWMQIVHNRRKLVHEWMVSLKLLYSSTYVAKDWLGCIAHCSDLPVNFYIYCIKMFRAYCVHRIWLIIFLIYTKLFQPVEPFIVYSIKENKCAMYIVYMQCIGHYFLLIVTLMVYIYEPCTSNLQHVIVEDS